MSGITRSGQPVHWARHRGAYVLCIAVVICLGLGSRSDFIGLPPTLAEYAGDALWALMVFLGFGLMMAHRRTVTVAGLAVACCVVVETSQLYQAPWINELRQTLPGRLTLGSVFGWGDLAAYCMGIAIGALGELAMQPGISRKRATPTDTTAKRVS